MNILVTCGAGFIGSHAVEHHLKRGDEVVAVDDLSTRCREKIDAFERNPHFRFHRADLLDWDGFGLRLRVAVMTQPCYVDRG